MCRLVERPPVRTLFSDASKWAVQRCSMEMGWFWRYDFSDEEQARCCGSSIVLESEDQISINAAELLGMVMTVYVLALVCCTRPVGDSDCVLLRGDNEAAVQWVRRCRGAKQPRSGALMRLLRAIEPAGGWNFEALHVPGILKEVADGIFALGP